MLGRNFKRSDKVALSKLVGARMAYSRTDIAKMQQQDAARLLGFSNSSRLSKIEAATDTVNIPFNLIKDAADLYGVSESFLFGSTDDWDSRTPRDANLFLIKAMENARKRDMVILAKLQSEIRNTSGYTTALAEAAIETMDAYLKFVVMHPETEDMRISQLQHRIARADALSRQAVSALVRFKQKCVVAEQGPQLDLLSAFEEAPAEVS